MRMRCLVVNKLLKKVVKIARKEKLVNRYAILLFAMLISALNYNIFLSPLKIVAGGMNGISVITEKVFGIDPAVFIFFFSIVVLIAAYFLVGFELASSALVSAFVYPVFIRITSFISNIIVVDSEDLIVASVFAGVLTGLVSGLTCKVDLSQGGVTLINQILYHKFNVSISKTNFLLNSIIIMIGGYYFGINSILCALIFLYVSSQVIDKVMLGTSNNKTFYIITEEYEAVRDYITSEIKNGLTIFNVKSGKGKTSKSLIMVSVSNNNYPYVKRNLKKIDKNIFFAVTDSYQVVGGRTN